jgi:MYXO-CTERM domain-containing protein
LTVVALATAATPAFAQFATGNSDYYYSSAAYDFVDISSVGTIAVSSNDAEVNVALPWAFPFYGNTYSQVRVGGTGGIGFFTAGDLFNGNDDLPDTGYGSADVAAFWDSLNASIGEVYTYDDAGTRFIISWDGVATDSSGTDRDLTFQIQLYPNGDIQFHYLDVVTSNSSSLGGSATVGIQDVVGGTAVSGSNFLEFSYNTASLVDGMALQFGIDAAAADADGDGVASTVDCDDTDASFSPLAQEICGDGLDQDCNGLPDPPSDVDGDGAIAAACGGLDCDDTDPTLNLDDADNDGVNTCDGDCDDADPTVYAGATEICDGIDQNCDGDVSDETDDDGDGFTECAAITGQAPGGDCDDTNPNVSPALSEICGNGLDDDCDGAADNLDVDGDGSIAAACGGGDCDDGDPAIYENAPETCDGSDVDQNCNGVSDSFDLSVGLGSTVAFGETGGITTGTQTFDATVAGVVNTISSVTVTVDITHTWDGDLSISLISPAGTNVNLTSANGGSADNYRVTTFDDNATTPITSGSAPFNGTFAPESPLSAFATEAADGVWTLDVTDSFGGDDGTVHSWSIHILDGTVDDVDGDGNVGSCGDCDDNDANLYEGNVEICGNGVDEDCSGADDTLDADADGEDSITCGGLDCDDTDAAILSTADVDGDLVFACDGDCDDNDASIFPGAVEIACDTIDNDCDGFDGVGDDGLSDVDGDGETPCGGDCDDTLGSVNSSGVETCNGLDNDCNGVIGIDLDGDGATSCGDVDCDDADPLVFPGAPEVCDGADVDSNCDGNLDGFDPTTDAVLQTDTFSGSVGPIPVTGTGGSSSTQASFTTTAAATLDIILDINVTLDLTHTWAGDLVMTLTSPTGTSVLLVDELGGSGDNYTNTTFDDQAAASITSSSPPFTGTFRPQGSLADFNGEAADGVWTLDVVDNYNFDSGAMNSWTIEILSATDVDLDDDGNNLCSDCNDTDPAIFVGAVEICGNGIDEDCSGADDALDVDTDGEDSLTCGGTDCDDADILVNAAATEICNDAIDNDCDEATVDIFDGDLDGDLCDTDCDDAEPLAFAGNYEICNDTIDNDCDATTPDLGDFDGDGINCDTDCDDTNALMFPGATELFCDSLDNDCDPTTLDLGDGDGDTFNCDVDCDDDDAAVNPAATEVLCDGIDNDCDPTTISDGDGDNDGANCDVDCDDTDPTVSPDFDEICNDGVDNDCDATTIDLFDADGDGDPCDTDCDDDDPGRYTGAPEYCNDGLDQDCDGLIDELVNDSYPLGNDDDLRIELCGMTFPFCGTDWTTVFVQSNGRVTFGFSDVDHTESVVELTAQYPQIAPMWTDLDPTLNQASDIHIEELEGLTIIDFTDIAEVAAAGTSNTFELALYDDGTASIVYGTNSVLDGLVGFACGDGSTGDLVSVDFSDYEFASNQWAVGSGTEDAIYEVFTEGTDANDLSGGLIDLCLTAGDDLDADGWTDTCGDDVDDDSTIYPGAPELCDGLDNDLDGVTDNVDVDEDTYIDIDCGGDDCDDDDEDTFPDAPELCDGLDNDCDGAPETGFEDDDADGVQICDGDCDDGDDTIYGGDEPAEEICDLKDNNCDGEVDEGQDNDHDGDGAFAEECGGDDCDDREAAAYPGNAEICDQIDNDCNGVPDDVDWDGDDFFSAACGGLDCDDSDAEVNPDAEEIPYDEIDNDCSEGDLLDVDGDGYQSDTVAGGTDCDDNDATVNTGAVESSDAEGTCSDGKDNNCDGVIDLEDELCSACENCNASYTGEGPMGTPQAVFAFLIVLGLGLRRRRE